MALRNSSGITGSAQYIHGETQRLSIQDNIALMLGIGFFWDVLYYSSPKIGWIIIWAPTLLAQGVLSTCTVENRVSILGIRVCIPIQVLRTLWVDALRFMGLLYVRPRCYSSSFGSEVDGGIKASCIPQGSKYKILPTLGSKACK